MCILQLQNASDIDTVERTRLVDKSPSGDSVEQSSMLIADKFLRKFAYLSLAQARKPDCPWQRSVIFRLRCNPDKISICALQIQPMANQKSNPKDGDPTWQ